jgi:hypothetical protein
MRNHVEALVATKQPPSMGEYVEATFKADLAVQKDPKSPWGYAARCLVAFRIGDRDMLDRCTADLKRVAPDHEETKRILAMASHRESVLGVLARWLLILALLGTTGHALWNRRRPGGGAVVSPPATLVGIFAFVLSMIVTSAAAKADPLRGPGLAGVKIDEANPEASIPTFDQQMKNPLHFGYVLQDMLAYAQAASKRDDLEAAARYYIAIAKAVPERAFSYSRLCEIHDHLGNRDRALEFCRAALTRDGVTILDYDRTVGLIMAAPLTRESRAELDAISKHVESLKDGTAGVQQLRCRIALALHDVPALESCTSALAKVAATDGTTLSYQWALAIERHDFAGAQQLVTRASKAGIAPEALAKMTEATAGQRRQWRIKAGLVALAIAAAAVGLWLAARRFGFPRRRAPASV